MGYFKPSFYHAGESQQYLTGLIDINRVYLQVFMGFGFIAFMSGQWVWETPLGSGVDLSHESQIQLYHIILLLESKLPFWRFLPHFPMYSDANNSASIRST